MAYDSIDSKTAISINKDIIRWRNMHSLVKANNERWYIGITNNPERRKKQHKSKSLKEGYNVSFFEFWYAKTINISSAIETYWHLQGMLETDQKGNIKTTSVYVYVFKKYPIFRR